MTSRRATAELAVTIVLFGSSFPVYKLATEGFGVGTVAAVRFLLATAVMVAVLGVPSLDRRTWLRVGAIGAVGLGGQALAMTAGIDAGTSTLGALILGLEPIGIAVVAVLVAGERPAPATVAGLGLGIVGAAIVSGLVTEGTDGLPVTAVSYLLLTVVLFAGYTVSVRRLSAEIHPGAVAVATSLGGTALTLPLLALDAARGDVVHGAGWGAAVALAYMGVGTGVAYLLFAHVLARIDASRFAVVLYAVPTLGVLASWAILGERPLGRDVAGGAVILLAVWVSERSRAGVVSEPTSESEDTMPQLAERLRGIPEIRRFFRTQQTPVYFVSATAFNLLGMDRWLPALRYVNYYDSFDGHHPRVFVPRERADRAFESIEEICNYLLAHKETRDLVTRGGGSGKAVFLMFDEDTERLAREAGIEVAFPPAALRHRLDSKIETTRIAAEAGVPSVPNVLGRATTYAELRALAEGAALGADLVVQTPYGDSGQTTFFVADEADWNREADAMAAEELKVMRRIACREAAIEGVITRHGTLVGPLMAELAGFPELTPYGGGWCGNDVAPTVFSDRHREVARAHARAMGDRLAAEGYRGYFELDFLADVDTGEMYLGELNPRVTGASSITNVTAVAYGDMPLFLFHLLEFMDVDYEIDVDELNQRWAHPHAIDAWSQFILKQTDETVELITRAPTSGIWRLERGGSVAFVRRDTDWHTVADESEAFYLRIAAAGSYRYPGADLGILVTRGRLMDEEHNLTERAHAWISGIKAQFGGVAAEPAAPVPPPEPFSFKML